jgi:hypothetical protein
MSHAQGKPFTPEEKKFIVLLKQYFDRCRWNDRQQTQVKWGAVAQGIANFGSVVFGGIEY